jgi:cytochrome c peroxidase
MCYPFLVNRLFLLVLLPVLGIGLTWLRAEDRSPPEEKPLTLGIPGHFPKPTLPPDNLLTEQRRNLGERLFHDTILSIDGTVSCAACHVPEFAFGDDVDLSRGFNGRLGRRNSQPLFNLAWKPHFFRDGRVASLREQVLEPIQNHLEMAASLRRVLFNLNRNDSYRKDFAKAYGPGPITENTLALALENFLLGIVSTDSRYDRFKAGQEKFTPREKQGHDLFFTPRSAGGAGCFQCHGGPEFTDHRFRNNGLKPVSDLNDLGRYEVTQKDEDKFLFATPTLRNIALTAPYMHDGRFARLSQAVAHYASPLHESPTLDPRLPAEGLGLDEDKQAALVAFLETLTDPQFVDSEVE